MTHFFYIASAYAIAAISLIGLVGWIWFDLRRQQRRLAELEASGTRRRAARHG